MRHGIYKGYLLTLLTVIYAFNFVDRLALGIVLPNIKSDLVLSDTQLGVLSGIAFAIFYAFMGVPIACWADRGNRVLIIALTTALWSIAVAVCGLAETFAQLLLVRIGVAVGEAGAFAPGMSLLSDYFERSERPQAVAIYLLAWPLSCIIGYLVAGWLNETYGWRLTFGFLAAPGILLAVAARFTLTEPRIDRLPGDVSSLLRLETADRRKRNPGLRRVLATL
jgi:MFS transporter, Spinster family, sphingosine-1-phosphate transporter